MTKKLSRRQIADAIVDILFEQGNIVADDLGVDKDKREVFIAGYAHGRMDEMEIQKQKEASKAAKRGL